MIRTILAVLLAVTLAGSPAWANQPGGDVAEASQTLEAAAFLDTDAVHDVIEQFESAGESESRDAAAKCCKICRKGKACGDSCISKSKTCHKGPGCACNGS